MASTSISMSCSGGEQSGDLDHGYGGANVGEALTTGDGDLFPFFDVDDLVADTGDVFDGGAGCGECRLAGGSRLSFDALGSGPVGLGGAGAENVEAITGADGAGVADAVFPRTTGGNAGAASHVGGHSAGESSLSPPLAESLPLRSKRADWGERVVGARPRWE